MNVHSRLCRFALGGFLISGFLTSCGGGGGGSQTTPKTSSVASSSLISSSASSVVQVSSAVQMSSSSSSSTATNNIAIESCTNTTAEPNCVVRKFTISKNLIDPVADESAKKLYTYLLSQFGKRIISGQTAGNVDFDYIKKVTGKTPLIRDFDMQHYSPMYSYKWDGSLINPKDNSKGYFVFGPDTGERSAEIAIDWYNTNAHKPIIDFQWHWHSPSGGIVGTNTFYTEYTTFDVTKAVVSGTQENMDILRDIDAIAVQLKKLSAAGVPILWRPLHEIGGTWFWWSAKGPAPAKALWNIVYDRLTNYHQLHNLIWIWNGNDAAWYPGDNKADIASIDSYPGDNNYTINKEEFDKIYTITKGTKILAMSENGPIPDINKSLNGGAPWSFFMSWGDVWIGNNDQHLIDIYSNPNVITVENYDDTLN